MKKSFTLIELLIVLVIIGIVATFAIPKMEVLVINSRGAEAMQMLTALSDSVTRYIQEAGVFPPENESNPPSQIDTKIPDTTKYFRYQYEWQALGPQVLFSAIYIYEDFSNLPIGTVLSYRIIFSGHYATGSQLVFPYVYKHYFHTVKSSETGSSLKAGWP